MAKVPWKKREFARHLRREQTDAEKALWKILRSRQLENYKFRRQHVISPFVTDFCCLEPKLIIELDGSQHLDNKAYDQMRTEQLQEKGFHVIRFWDKQVLKETKAVTARIYRALTRPSATLSHPADGRGKA